MDNPQLWDLGKGMLDLLYNNGLISIVSFMACVSDLEKAARHR